MQNEKSVQLGIKKNKVLLREIHLTSTFQTNKDKFWFDFLFTDFLVDNFSSNHG